MRKIIQISESTIVSDIYGEGWNLSALCDDGTVWIINGVRDGKGNPCEWLRMPDIPQDEIPMTPSEYAKHLHEEERREQWREEMRLDAFGEV